MNANAAQEPLFARVALIGVGLIGASLARVLRRENLAGHIAGCVRSAASRGKCLELGLADSMHDAPGDAVEGADLVVLCTPIGTYAGLAEAIAPRLAQGAIVTDVGSVKQSVIRDVGPYVPEGVHFVPGHPVAGSERSGPEAGFAELFEGRWCILTPPPEAPEHAIEAVAAMWRRCGMRIERMDPQHHDSVLAITSHVPHVIAYTIVGTALGLAAESKSEVFKFAAGGFRDFTRIAGSDPVMWRDVLLNNREAVLEMLGRFTEDLAALQRAIRWGEGERLHELFTSTREIRRGVVEAGQAGTFIPTEAGTRGSAEGEEG